MPIAELGYRHWEGKRTGPFRRAMAIARSEIAIAFGGSKILRRFLVLAWVPILYFCPFFLAVGYVADPNNDLDSGAILTEIATDFLSRDAIALLRAHPELFLPPIWSIAFYFFFAYTGSLFAMIVVAIVGPPLISKDLRSKAFLVYYSKPIRPWQYLLGKLATVVFFIFTLTLFPGLLLYLVGVGLSPDFNTLAATLPIILQVVGSSLVIAVPVSLVALFLSSLTKDRRIATFSWMALWVFGEVAFRILAAASNFSTQAETPAWASALSIRELTTRATSGVFDVRGNLEDVFLRLGDSGDRLSHVVRGMAADMGEARFADVRLRDTEVLDIVAGGFSPVIATGLLALISIVTGLFILRRSTKPVRI